MLRAAESSGDVDNPALQGSFGSDVAVPARIPAARRRLCAMAAHNTQAELAMNRPARCASSPSMRSANRLSMIACRRSTRAMATMTRASRSALAPSRCEPHRHRVTPSFSATNPPSLLVLWPR
jgi:hypothetical protein